MILGKPIQKSIMQVGLTILLAFTISSCLKPIDLDINPKEDLIVYGNIANTNSIISIRDLTSKGLTSILDADVYIEFNGKRHRFKSVDSHYELTNTYLPPNTPYQLTVESYGKKNTFDGQLPDTVTKAELSLVQIKGFRYEFRLELEVQESEMKFGYLWSPNGQYTSKSFEGNSTIGYEENFLKRFSKEPFFVAPTNPLTFNKDYQARIERVYAHTIDSYKTSFENSDNRDNPLYIKYNPKSDVVIDNVLFRINQITNIETNLVRVEDTTPTLIECDLVIDEGKTLSPDTYQSLQFSIRLEGNRLGIDVPMTARNPMTISLNQLAPLVASGDDDIKLEELLNRPLSILILGTDGTNGRVGALAEITLSNLTETNKLTVELERE